MIRLRQVEVPIFSSPNTIKKKVAKKLQISPSKIKQLEIRKESLDARRKPELFYVYEVDVEVEEEAKIVKQRKNKDIFIAPKEEYAFEITGKTLLLHRPIIVGAGPAGLFCAYQLAEAGYRPLIIERGEKIEDREKTVALFWEKGILNPESNVQFGEGGAGTFSDGKLNTLIKTSLDQKKVFDIFVSCGANKEILYKQKPHIGTDELRNIIIKIREKIIELGGEFRYNTCLTNLFVEDGYVVGIEVNGNEKIDANVVVLAIGHSARTTFFMLQPFLKMEQKNFAVGIRIQHKQKDINKAQYGQTYADKLPAASYKLTYQTKEKRGVYTFCMCPGGFVVNASSEEGKLAINGMSNHARNEENANSAVVVTVTPKDVGTDLFSGMLFQEALEKKAYTIGHGNIPVTLYKDFKQKKISTSFGTIKPIFKGNIELANIASIFPTFINDALIEAIEDFAKKIPNFNEEDAILAAVESRTSCPIRILRNENGMSSVYGIYPCGEGAGYAGGITSSAVDGIKVAKWIASEFKRQEEEYEDTNVQ